MDDKVKVSCLECGATNNYPSDAGGKAVRCGRCKTPLSIPGQVLEPTAAQVATLIQSGGLPVLIDFYSPTCMPCHRMHPILESLAKRRPGELMVVKVNTDENAELAGAFRIQAVPTFVVIRRGTEVSRISGAMPETDFSLWVASRT
ncbi:MAG: thioredoxin domain-containing protein [Candidatus Aminicenantes bacterium]|nr:thioredoxin domain-containing protein [Candidatus Aminicenantes bacterium]